MGGHMSKRTTILIYILLGLLLLTSGCGNAKFQSTNNPALACSIVNDQIVCPDGSISPLPEDGVNGNDGVNGRDGINGADGTQINIVDPCGDGPGHDEVLLIFDNGSVLAWYLDIGFAVLQEGVNYQTTDAQECKFNVLDGVVTEI